MSTDSLLSICFYQLLSTVYVYVDFMVYLQSGLGWHNIDLSIVYWYLTKELKNLFIQSFELSMRIIWKQYSRNRPLNLHVDSIDWQVITALSLAGGIEEWLARVHKTFWESTKQPGGEGS